MGIGLRNWFVAISAGWLFLHPSQASAFSWEFFEVQSLETDDTEPKAVWEKLPKTNRALKKIINWSSDSFINKEERVIWSSLIDEIEHIEKTGVQIVEESYEDKTKRESEKLSGSQDANQIVETFYALPPKELQIRSDRQYEIDEIIFIAEGSVILRIYDGILKADKIEFNREKQIITATGSVRFIKGKQYFRASYFRFDLNEQEGEIKKVYGILDIQSLWTDVSLIPVEKSFENSSPLPIEKKIKKIDLKDRYNIEARLGSSSLSQRLDNDYADNLSRDAIDKAKLISNSINRWRVQSDHIILNKKGWKADKMNFSNDPFNPTQTRIEAEDVSAKQDSNGITLITSKRSKLILEERIRIPTGSREFGGKEEDLKWVFSIDSKDRDGLFVGRKLNPIDLGNNYQIKLEPQFLIQRALRGETDSYISPRSSVTSDKVSRQTNFSDMFGLRANLEGTTFDWKLDALADISTFNSDGFMNGSRYWVSISKPFILPLVDNVDVSFFGAYRYKAWNGSLGETDIYTAYGGFVEKKGFVESFNFNNSYVLRFGAGEYQAESSTSQKLVTKYRTSMYSKFKINYPIWQAKNSSEAQDTAYRYSPVVIQPGLDFDTEFSSSYFIYSGDQEQKSFKISAGPSITFGRFEKPFLDYTKFSIIPSIIFKRGDSPMKFDRAVDLKTVSVDLTQQIYGPLVLSSAIDFNIDSDSSEYGKAIASSFKLSWRRRSYDLSLYYTPYNGTGGFNFRLNGFEFDGTGNPFVADENETSDINIINSFND